MLCLDVLDAKLTRILLLFLAQLLRMDEGADPLLDSWCFQRLSVS